MLTAVDGAEGFTLARDLVPDLIVSDFMLPRINGLSMLETLHADGLDVPFILITAEGSEALAVRALRLGVSDYLIKPFDVVDLLDAIERTLKRHWTRQIQEHIPTQLLETNLQLEQRLRELDTLMTLGKRVTGQLDLEQVLTHVVDAAAALSGAENGSLMLIDAASGELYLYASTQEHDQDFRLPVADSLAGQVVQTGEPLVITGSEPQKIKTDYFFRSLVYVPVGVKTRMIGVLGVTNTEEAGEFEPHTLRLLGALADFAAIAIENARLYESTQHERDTLNTILRDSEDVIIVVDDSNRIVFCNPAAGRTFTIDCAASEGLPLHEVIAHQEVIDLFENDLHGGRSRRSEIALDDSQRFLNAQLTVVKGVGRVAVMQDITHLKELDRIKGEFVTTVSHDLRSPLTAILGYIELVSRTGPLNETQQTFVQRIVFSVKSISTLIADLLELGKIEAGLDEQRQPILLQEVVQYAVESQRHQFETKHQRVDVTLPDNITPVLGHGLRLRQVVTNLVENAVKYTPENGQIRITLEEDGDLQILRVEDTGIGIPQKDLPYIFDKFYRADEAVENFSGTGLGLSIVKGIVEHHAGRIWVDSQVGKGSVFTVMLPSHQPDGQSAHSK